MPGVRRAIGAIAWVLSAGQVNWLVDAQLPLALAVAIRMTGRDVRHTLDLPRANQTKDDQIRALVLVEDRAVITKDRGFRASHMLTGQPNGWCS